MQPVYTFGGLAAVAGALAAYELFQDFQFQQAAKKDLAGASYVQVGMAVPAGSAKSSAASASAMV